MSLLKGFTSLFDWMFPKSLEEQLEDLDDSMQNLYNRMGWGKYNNPVQGYQNSVDINRSVSDDWYNKYLRGEPVEFHGSIEELEKLLPEYPTFTSKEKIVPETKNNYE